MIRDKLYHKYETLLNPLVYVVDVIHTSVPIVRRRVADYRAETQPTLPPLYWRMVGGIRHYLYVTGVDKHGNKQVLIFVWKGQYIYICEVNLLFAANTENALAPTWQFTAAHPMSSAAFRIAPAPAGVTMKWGKYYCTVGFGRPHNANKDGTGADARPTAWIELTTALAAVQDYVQELSSSQVISNKERKALIYKAYNAALDPLFPRGTAVVVNPADTLFLFFWQRFEQAGDNFLAPLPPHARQ